MNDISISPYGFGNSPRGQDPMGPTGVISNSYQPSPQARLFGRVLEALQDPRNSWMGLGAIRGLGPLRGRLFQDTREMGGFNVPTSQMRRDMGIPRENTFKYQPPTGESQARQTYLNILDALNKDAQSPGDSELLRRIAKGQHELDQFRHNRMGFGSGSQ